MIAFYTFRCPECHHEVEASDEGYSYILDDAGRRHFFYHPLERDVVDRVVDRRCRGRGKTPAQINQVMPSHCGCMSDVICCHCGETWRVDDVFPSLLCLMCGGADVIEALKLGGKMCFKCKRGRFPEEPELSGIS